MLQNDAETENIEVLTDQKFKSGKHCNYVIERNWEFIEGLKCSRFNFGMSAKPTVESPVPASPEQEEITEEPASKRARLRVEREERFKNIPDRFRYKKK